MFRYIAKNLIISFLVPLLLAVSSDAQVISRAIAPGVELLQAIDDNAPLAISALKVAPGLPGTEIRAFVGFDRIRTEGQGRDRETVGSAVSRKGAVAGVNADFFPWTGDPLGFTVVDGRIVSEPDPKRPAAGIFPDGTARLGIVQMSLTFDFGGGRYVKPVGVDRPVGQGELIVKDREWGPTTGYKADFAEMVIKADWEKLTETGEVSGEIVAVHNPAVDSAIPEDGIVLVAKGPRIQEMLNASRGRTSVVIKLVLQDEDGRSWLGVRQAAGGGSWLVKKGSVYQQGAASGFNAAFTNNRHPRTGIGITQNGSILMLVADGRQNFSRGATLNEMSRIMMDFGCTDAINLDGGGSSTLVVRDMVINSPSDGVQRAVASGFLIHAPEFAGLSSAPLEVKTPLGPLKPGQKVDLKVAVNGQEVQPPATGRLVWGTANGGGFVDQNGRFTATRPGTPLVRAWLSGSSGEATVQVIPEPLNLAAAWDAASEPSGRILVVTATRGTDNGIAAGVDITVKAAGVTVTPQSAKTDDKGTARFVLSVPAGTVEFPSRVEVTSEGHSIRIDW